MLAIIEQMKGNTIYSFAVLLDAFAQTLLNKDWKELRKMTEEGWEGLLDEEQEHWQALQEIGNAVFEASQK